MLCDEWMFDLFGDLVLELGECMLVVVYDEVSVEGDVVVGVDDG